MPALPAGVVLNRMDREGVTPGSATVLLMDQRNTPRLRQAYAIQQIDKFVAKHRDGERVGIYVFTRKGVLAVPDLTSDGELLKRSVRNLKPVEPETSKDPCDFAGFGVDGSRECVAALLRARASETKEMFLGIARHLANIPGRKSIVWVTAGFPLLSRTFDFTPDMKAVVRALNDADTAVYAVDARGLDSGHGVHQPGSEVMDLVASGTGGSVFLNSNDLDGAIRVAVEDGDIVYTLGFYPPEDSKDGQEHTLKVRVDRQGVSLRYRESYSTEESGGASLEHPASEQLLADSLDATQIQIAAKVVRDSSHIEAYQLRVSVNLHDVQFERKGETWVGGLTLSFKVEGSQTFRSVTRLLDVPVSQFAALIEKGVLIETPVPRLKPGDVLRIVVQDQSTGAAGSLRLPVVAE